MHGCASELEKYVGPEYEVTGTIMPGLRLQNVMKLAKNEIVRLSNRDAVIIFLCGGGVLMMLIETKQ